MDRIKKFFNNNLRQKIMIIGGIILLLFVIVIIVVIVSNNSSTTLLDYDMSEVTLSDETVEYDGEEHSIEIEGDLPEGVSVSYTYNGEETTGQTEIGEHAVVASFEGDSSYNTISDMTATLTISEISFDISGFSLSGETVEYDGEEHSLEITGDLSDDESVSYTYNGQSVSGVSSLGSYTVVATIIKTDEHYTDTTQTLSATLIITETTSYTYTIDGEEATITGYTGSDTELVIPSYVIDEDGNTYTVTALGDYLFGQSYADQNNTITSITVSSGITTLGSYCFAYLTDLEYVSFPETVTEISEACCNLCSSLTIVDLSSQLVSFDNYCFSNCSNLTDIDIPQTVTNFGDESFYSTGITSVEISSGASLGRTCFGWCKSLTSITFEGTITSLGASAIYGTAITSIEIPSGITSIPNGCFCICENLKSVTLPDTITSIGYDVFLKCYALTTVNIPSDVTSIGDNCFEYCFSLTSITIPSEVMSIGQECFLECDELGSIIFSDTDYTYWIASVEIDGSGEGIEVSDSSANASYFTTTYVEYYWRKDVPT